MNDFQIISKLGEGAFSTVYKVKRKIDNKVYALKKVKFLNLSEKEEKNALNEVRLLASVKSRYVISYKEAFYDEKDNTLGIVMEFADSGDLYQQIVRHKQKAEYFNELEIWRIFIQLVKGLKALHDLNILHRDIKSANVFINSDDTVKLGDLNVSKVARKGLGYTQTGTPYYASPEVWKDLPYDNKSDIWSLGCVLYEMVTLKPPFRAQNMEGLFNKVIKGSFNKIPDCFSKDLQEIISLLLKVDSRERPSCEQILKHPIVKRKTEFIESMSSSNKLKSDEDTNPELLQTIRVPKNLLFLGDKLPLPNYDNNTKFSTRNKGNSIFRSISTHKELLNRLNNLKQRGNLNLNRHLSNNLDDKKILVKGNPNLISGSCNKIKTNESKNNSEPHNNCENKINSKDYYSLDLSNEKLIKDNKLKRIIKVNSFRKREFSENSPTSIDNSQKFKNLSIELPRINSYNSHLVKSKNKGRIYKSNSLNVIEIEKSNSNGNKLIDKLYIGSSPYQLPVKPTRKYVNDKSGDVSIRANSRNYLNNLEKYYNDLRLYKKHILNDYEHNCLSRKNASKKRLSPMWKKNEDD